MGILSDFHLLVVIHHIVDKVHHGFAGLADVLQFSKPVTAFKEIVGDGHPAAVVLHPEILEELVVLGKTFRNGLQGCKAEAFLAHLVVRPSSFVRSAEQLCKVRILHIFPPFVDVCHDLIATGCKDIRRQPVAANGHQAVARL